MLVMVWMGGIAPSGIWNGSSKSGDHGWVRGKCRTSRHGMQPANPPYMASQDQQMFVVRGNTRFAERAPAQVLVWFGLDIKTWGEPSQVPQPTSFWKSDGDPV